jgi:uncharacterized membrane protein YtjA (UPF0391 family)
MGLCCADRRVVGEGEPEEPMNPPVGWAQLSKIPPGMSDPDRRPGFTIRVFSFAILVTAVLLTLFGNWVVAQPDESLAGTSQGDAVLGIAAFLFLISLVLQIVGLVMSRRALRAPHTDGLT